ncbi:MAG: hypothetical protein PHU80_03270, partial [Kiritimatiellae bacterium]|nr:hypothetical protein [Kiritimatiellia bacterium]
MGRAHACVWLVTTILFAGCLGGCSFSAKRVADGQDDLCTARKWLRQNPPDGNNRAVRRGRMALLQQACDSLSVDDYRVYFRAMETNAAQSDLSEKTHPALGYLR